MSLVALVQLKTHASSRRSWLTRRVVGQINHLSCHTSNEVGWYGTAYMGTNCAFLPVFEMLYTFLNVKVGSAVCGAAANPVAFIIGPGTALYLILIIYAVPLIKRHHYQALFGATYGVSSIIGPLIGGTFASNVSLEMVLLHQTSIWRRHPVCLYLAPAKDVLRRKYELAQLNPEGVALLPGITCLIIRYIFAGFWGSRMIGVHMKMLGNSAIVSGIHLLPLMVAMVDSSIISDVGTTHVCYYMPFLITSTRIITVIIYGFGFGCCFPEPDLAAQTVLPHKIRVTPETIVRAGITGLFKIIPSQYHTTVLKGYNSSLGLSFVVALVCACLSVIGSLGIE
ncbi:hypothetical protein BDV23DRAFT_195206 [Aspergillus alliaceus]|uniref:Major facilitator superfamily domain-containing protein n=1 Tax=Petromyces alliaceus TaxID=209559 RepID=A0A5N7C3F0_PETAA|nr:hypothetical protein BDV23DRAFT_195206 [Aspergillus alliaceus]